MRPTRLEVEGFTCFKDKVEVDFSDLDLFAVTGPTGAGKTSLIDAMIFALYGRTPRLGEKQASELISQGRLKLSVLLEFESGKRRWRLARTLRRTPRATHTKAQLESLRGEEWKAEASAVGHIRKRVERIIGLDYDGFTKSVVLPQGEFDRFLKGTPKERRDILTELLGLHIYEQMGKRSRDIAKEAQAIHRTKQEQLEKSYAQATPQARKELKARLRTVKSEMGDLESRAKEIEEASPLASEMRRIKNAAEQARKDRQAREKRVTEGEAKSKKLKKEVEKRREAIAKLERDRREAGYDEGRYLDLARLAPRAEEQERIEARLKERKARTAKLSQQVEEAQEAREETGREQAAAEKAAASEEERLEKRRAALEEFRSRHGSVEALKQLAGRLAERSRLRERSSQLRESIAEAKKREKRLEAQIDKAQAELEDKTSSWKESQRRLQRLQRMHAAEGLRRELEEGEPCPVCLREVEEVPGEPPHAALEEAAQAEERTRQERDQLNERIREQRAELKTVPRTIEVDSKALEDAASTLAEIDRRIGQALGETPEEDPSGQLESLIEKAERLKARADEASRGHAAAAQALQKARSAAAQAQHAVELAQKDLETLAQQIEEDKARLGILRKKLEEWPSPKRLREELKQQEKARARYRQLGEKLDSQRKALAEARLREQRAADRLESFREQLKSARQRLEKLQNSLEDVEKRLEEKLKQLFEELPLFQEAPSKRPQGDAAQRLEGERRKVESRLNSLRSERARGEERLEQLERQIREAKQLREEIREEKQRADVARELGLSLRANQFIAFIQEEAFRRLAEGGTVHLKALSNDRYSFGIDQDRFSVLDHWNADEPRPVNTLSGGESFLASLSLALALADSLSELASDRESASLESLFLDEGFSTLDSETLDMVVQSVETLSSDHRLIGVISHVPELAERFPSRIQVKKSIAGSTLELE